jgi:hypothetical protein
MCTRMSVQRHLVVVAPPRDVTDRVERQRLDGGVRVRPHPLVERDEVIARLLGRGPHVGVGLRVVVEPRHRLGNGRSNVSPK